VQEWRGVSNKETHHETARNEFHFGTNLRGQFLPFRAPEIIPKEDFDWSLRCGCGAKRR
jgi:hypothetical protein